MTEENETVTRSGHGEKGDDPGTADEIIIRGHVMLGFADQSFALGEEAQRGIVTEPWRSS